MTNGLYKGTFLYRHVTNAAKHGATAENYGFKVQLTRRLGGWVLCLL